MRRSMRARLFSVFLLGFMLCPPSISNVPAELLLSGVHLVGTDQLNGEDVIHALGLHMGKPISSESLVHACDRLRNLKLFASLKCTTAVYGHHIWLTVSVKVVGMPVVFDNFVWTTKQELTARLRRDIPLFMPELPERSGLTGDIIRVLQQVVDERGIRGRVGYDAHFWTNRGMNVFYIEGISVPVTSFQIVGENAPSQEQVRKFSEVYLRENFSAARLTWVIQWVIRDLYNPRGYLRPSVAKPEVRFLGEKDGAFPVGVVLHISSGDLYVFESVKFEGLAKPYAPSLLSKWRLRPGDPYDEAYVNSFISTEILDEPWAAYSKVQSDAVLPCTRIDAATKKVSLEVLVKTPKKAYMYPKNSASDCGGVMTKLTLPKTL